MLPAILGGLATGAGSSLIGGLFGGGGGGAPEYEPSELMQSLADYGEGQLKASKTTKKKIKAEAKSFSSPGAREAFLEPYADRYANNEFILKQLQKSYKKPIDYEKGGYRDVASFAYGQQGMGMPEEDFQRYLNVAKTTNVRSPEAFSDLVRQSMIASGKVKTPQDLAWESQYGTMPRDAQGNLVKGMVRYNPEQVQSMIKSMIG
jgi:hypothetical protein